MRNCCATRKRRQAKESSMYYKESKYIRKLNLLNCELFIIIIIFRPALRCHGLCQQFRKRFNVHVLEFCDTLKNIENMQRNKIKAKDKLIDILNAFLKGNPINSFEKLLSLTSEQHRYLDQWKKLNVDPQTLEKVVDIIRRFEANGLQLEGKGVWVLLMCFKYCYNGDKLAKETQTSLVETLIRIALEHSVYVDCIEILQYVVDNMELTPSEVFQIGNNQVTIYTHCIYPVLLSQVATYRTSSPPL